MNVLIVDDHPNISRVSAISFSVLGCRPFTAGSTAEARRILSTEKIDALFLDVNLAGECGLEFLSRVTAQSVPPPVVMFTALDPEEVKAEATRRGALDCLPKPFTLDDLRVQLARIERYLEHRKHQPRSP